MKVKGEDRVTVEAQSERIIDLIVRVISLNNDSLNESIKDCIIEANAVLRPIIRQNDDRLVPLLQHLGESEEILDEVLVQEDDSEDDDTIQPKEISKSFANPEPSLAETKEKYKRHEQSGFLEVNNNKKPPLDPKPKLSPLQKSPHPEEVQSLNPAKSFANSRFEGHPHESRDLNDDRSVVSEKEIIQQRDFAKKVVPYPKEYTLVPYKQLTLLEEKALLEIERVKQKKEERLQKKRIEENRKLIQEMKQKRTLRRQLEIRKVEHNIAPRNQKDIDFSLLLEEGVYEKAVPQKKEPNIELYTVEDEEDKDCEALKLFIEQHKRVFRYLYNRYANSGFSSKPKGSFDALKEKLSTISMAEIIKMLKDHSITLRMLSHSELASFIRLVNFKLIHKNDLTALTYQGFIELFVQIAIYIFSKEPYYNAHMPPVVHVEALLEHFKQAAKIKGENTALYDNPNATALGDPELMEELTKFVETNPFYPLPEGYKKVEEKYLHDNYVIPNYLVLPEATRFAVEIIDSMLNDALGIHVLEPITTYEYKVKVVPTIGKVYQRDPNEKRFMMPITKTLRKGILEPVKHPITLKQMNVKEIEPRLSPAIKLEVAKARKEMQPIIREVAEVVGEIVQAVEEGREGIGCRMKWGPSDILNKAIKDKLDKKREEELAKEEKEKQRKIRAVLIKNTVQELKREKARKEQEELELMYDVFGLYDLIFRKRQKEEEKKKFMKEKQLIEERKRKILEEKLKREEEEKKRIEEENKKSELERKKKAVELKVLKKRKELQFVLSE